MLLPTSLGELAKKQISDPSSGTIVCTFPLPFQVPYRGRGEDGEPTAGAAVSRHGQVITIRRPKCNIINISN